MVFDKYFCVFPVCKCNFNFTWQLHNAMFLFEQEFHKSSRARSSSMIPAPAYSPPEDSFKDDVAITVEKTMKKYLDNLMRFLEGISSRLSQLELYCYNLDKSIGEMRHDLVRDHGEADLKLKSLKKHLQEVSSICLPYFLCHAPISVSLSLSLSLFPSFL